MLTITHFYTHSALSRINQIAELVYRIQTYPVFTEVRPAFNHIAAL